MSQQLIDKMSAFVFRHGCLETDCQTKYWI